jgi:hypothetical protein
MTARTWVRWCGAMSVGVAMGLVVPGPVAAVADGTKDQPKAKPKPDSEPPTTVNPITISPSDLTFGADKKRVIAIYEKVIDDDYKDRYQKVQPGPDM